MSPPLPRMFQISNSHRCYCKIPGLGNRVNLEQQNDRKRGATDYTGTQNQERRTRYALTFLAGAAGEIAQEEDLFAGLTL